MPAEKNLHLEHVEDEIFNFGTNGARESITFLRSLRDLLSKKSDDVSITTKFDGAPAIFCGYDPADEKFFIGTKGVFNKTPKVVKTHDDISELGYTGDLADKLHICLDELSKLDIPKGIVLQGDLLWVKTDLKDESIDGDAYTIFQPNTIVYAVLKDTDLNDAVRNADLGIVFHTTYKGKTLSEMTASFGADVDALSFVPNIWYANAEFSDFSTLVGTEVADITKLLSSAGKTFQTIATENLDKFLAWQKTLDGNRAGLHFKCFNNKFIREGREFSKPKDHVQEYVEFFIDGYSKRFIDKVKTEKAKNAHYRKLFEHVSILYSCRETIEKACVLYNHFITVKNLIIEKLNAGVSRFPGTFVLTDNGYRSVNDEGYVAVNDNGSAVKLIDRPEFSYNNFNSLKNWS
tara:strand:- start:10654 stop:11868 length:1215 start_codon:yes stop_codon:yes gene_type:complete